MLHCRIGAPLEKKHVTRLKRKMIGFYVNFPEGILRIQSYSQTLLV